MFSVVLRKSSCCLFDFARTDVQDAIHAPHIEWSDCAAFIPYVNETDNSVPPAANHVLPNVIEKSERSAVVHGLAVRITFFS